MVIIPALVAKTVPDIDKNTLGRCLNFGIFTRDVPIFREYIHPISHGAYSHCSWPV
jgi:hypothetical protein